MNTAPFGLFLILNCRKRDYRKCVQTWYKHALVRLDNKAAGKNANTQVLRRNVIITG